MVSIYSSHFFNWTDQLRGAGHEIYWLDIFDSDTKVAKISFVNQITGWRYRSNFPGRYFLKRKAPLLNWMINRFNEKSLEEIFVKKFQEIKPDVVHSFTMHLGCFPIFQVMRKNPDVKWILSSWGSDIFYYQAQERTRVKMEEVFTRIDFMFSDCLRDHRIAKKLGFKGKSLGVFPGRGGFEYERYDPLIKGDSGRNLILIKGYQGKHGRCIEVLEAMLSLRHELTPWEIVIFGANKEVLDFISQEELKSWKNLKVSIKIPYDELMALMGRARIYIGNSLSDGTPNTLLEAIIMGAFPIQSNPGGATAELIIDEKNGLLIQEPENIKHIRDKIKTVLNNQTLIDEGVEYNLRVLKPLLERSRVREKVLQRYKEVERAL